LLKGELKLSRALWGYISLISNWNYLVIVKWIQEYKVIVSLKTRVQVKVTMQRRKSLCKEKGKINIVQFKFKQL